MHRRWFTFNRHNSNKWSLKLITLKIKQTIDWGEKKRKLRYSKEWGTKETWLLQLKELCVLHRAFNSCIYMEPPSFDMPIIPFWWINLINIISQPCFNNYYHHFKETWLLQLKKVSLSFSFFFSLISIFSRSLLKKFIIQ